MKPDEMIMDRKPEAADIVGAGQDPADASLDADAEPVGDAKAAVALTRRLTYDKGLSNRSEMPLMTPSENLLTSQDMLDLPKVDEEEVAAAPPINENEIKVEVSTLPNVSLKRMQTDIQEKLQRKI